MSLEGLSFNENLLFLVHSLCVARASTANKIKLSVLPFLLRFFFSRQSAPHIVKIDNLLLNFINSRLAWRYTACNTSKQIIKKGAHIGIPTFKTAAFAHLNRKCRYIDGTKGETAKRPSVPLSWSCVPGTIVFKDVCCIVLPATSRSKIRFGFEMVSGTHCTARALKALSKRKSRFVLTFFRYRSASSLIGASSVWTVERVGWF